MFSLYLSEFDVKNVLENCLFDGWGSVDDFLVEVLIVVVDSKVKDEVK